MAQIKAARIFISFQSPIAFCCVLFRISYLTVVRYRINADFKRLIANQHAILEKPMFSRVKVIGMMDQAPTEHPASAQKPFLNRFDGEGSV